MIKDVIHVEIEKEEVDKEIEVGDGEDCEPRIEGDLSHNEEVRRSIESYKECKSQILTEEVSQPIIKKVRKDDLSS